jgi:hypothetical protein
LKLAETAELSTAVKGKANQEAFCGDPMLFLEVRFPVEAGTGGGRRGSPWNALWTGGWSGLMGDVCLPGAVRLGRTEDKEGAGLGARRRLNAWVSDSGDRGALNRRGAYRRRAVPNQDREVGSRPAAGLG